MHLPFRPRRYIKDITSEVVDPIITLPLDGTMTEVVPDKERRIFVRGELIQLADDRYGHVFFDFVPTSVQTNLAVVDPPPSQETPDVNVQE
jgi:hypothetical protein